MPHYRRRPDGPALVESVTTRRFQGQTSRLSFVTLSIEQTAAASLSGNGVARPVWKHSQRMAGIGISSPPNAFQGARDALMTVCTPRGRVPRWGRFFFFFFPGWMWECVLTQYVQCNEREAERPRRFFFSQGSAQALMKIHGWSREWNYCTLLFFFFKESL